MHQKVDNEASDARQTAMVEDNGSKRCVKGWNTRSKGVQIRNLMAYVSRIPLQDATKSKKRTNCAGRGADEIQGSVRRSGPSAPRPTDVGGM